MARREKNKKHKHENSLEKEDFKRKENIKRQRISVILACEGEKTENYYFNELFRKLREEQRITKTSILKIVPHQHTHPTGVLDDLINYRDRFGNTYKEFDKKWIIIDRENVIRRLEECMKAEYKKSDSRMFTRLEYLIGDAIRNAELLEKNRKEMGQTEADANPSTKVFMIVKKLMNKK